ncbi:hypothetical protein D3C71_1195020 [compost metagenome]|jgi:IS5 family transposase
MKQSSFDLNLSTKKTRKQELLALMDRVVPWAALVGLIAPYYPEGKNGRPPFALEAMLRIHCMHVDPTPLASPSRLMINGLHTCIRLA